MFDYYLAHTFKINTALVDKENMVWVYKNSSYLLLLFTIR